MSIKKEKINFVYDDDLFGLLKKLGVFDDFNSKKILCEFCGEVVGGSNLHSLFKESGKIKFICDKPICVKKIMSYKK